MKSYKRFNGFHCNIDHIKNDVFIDFVENAIFVFREPSGSVYFSDITTIKSWIEFELLKGIL